ncbi:MAG: hypothetical protein V3T17_16115 [Pseudomonadales bacterium]
MIRVWLKRAGLYDGKVVNHTFKRLYNEKNTFTNADMLSLMRLGKALDVFEEILQELRAPAAPLTVLTQVVDGVVRIDIQAGFESLPISQFQDHPLTGAGVMPDYLEEYMVDGALDIGTLLHNDHYIAVKNLFNEKHYLSSMKLMVSFIDTLGYLDSGDIKGNVFVLWLNSYSNISKELGVTSEELWEFRNSILHMTNLDSRKVKLRKIKRISFMVAPKGIPAKHDHDTTYFNFSDLIFVIQKAIAKWLNTYIIDPTKLASFVKRYDRVISDSRMAKMP